MGEQLRRGTLAQLGGGDARPRAVPLRVCVGQTSWRQAAAAPVVGASREPSRLRDALAHGQSGRLGGAISGNHRLLGLHLKGLGPP